MMALLQGWYYKVLLLTGFWSSLTHMLSCDAAYVPKQVTRGSAWLHALSSVGTILLAVLGQSLMPGSS